MNLTNPFWVVWNPSRSAPTYQHASLDSATKEAMRLARLNPGQHFIVLASEAVYRKPDVEITILRHRDDIPF
ncbi:hypothetical protein [Petrachloros mirabilis]